MSFKCSRRRWLLSAAITSLSVSTSVSAQNPAGESRGLGGLAAPANLRVTSDKLPVQTRSVRLDATGESRTVITAIAADPRGQYVVAAGDDHKIRVLRISNLSKVEMLEGHRDVIRTLAFDPAGGRLVSAGNDGQVILWDRDDSFRVQQRMQGTPALACVRFSPDGSEMAAVGFAKELFIIGRRRQKSPVLQCNSHDLRTVAYRDDNRVLAVAGRSGDLQLFDPEGGRPIGDHSLHSGRIHDIAFHRQSNLAVCVGEDGCVTVFDTENRHVVHRIETTTGRLFCVAILNSQLVAVAGSDNVIRILNTDDGKLVRTLSGHAGSVSTLASSGGMLFSGSYDATLRRWSIRDVEGSEQRIAEGDPRIDR